MEKKREEEQRQREEEEELAAQAGGISLAEARDRKRKTMEVGIHAANYIMLDLWLDIDVLTMYITHYYRPSPRARCWPSPSRRSWRRPTRTRSSRWTCSRPRRWSTASMERTPARWVIRCFLSSCRLLLPYRCGLAF